VASIDQRFRADVNHSIPVFGDLTEQMVSALAVDILRLRETQSIITVLINSNGGATRCLDHLWGLLSTKGTATKKPRIITVAVGNAKSAAATLLAMGDYAIAYPNASIHFHGVRYGEVEDVTMEAASEMATQLGLKNQATASTLSRRGTKRLAFHYERLRSQFAEIRSQTKPDLSDIECFAACLKEHLSANGDKLVDAAIVRWQYLQDLSKYTIARERKLNTKSGLSFEAAVLRRIIVFEVARNKKSNPTWCLNADGVGQIMSDFLLLRDYDTGRHIKLMSSLVQQHKKAFFTDEEIQTLSDIETKWKSGEDIKSDEGRDSLRTVYELYSKTLKPFCYFASSLWAGLQQDENPLTPRDAYWLGAVDEIYGSKLPCLRQIVEAEPEQEKMKL
jgi:ATP-dependent protease ClpP protease subunit